MPRFAALILAALALAMLGLMVMLSDWGGALHRVEFIVSDGSRDCSFVGTFAEHTDRTMVSYGAVFIAVDGPVLLGWSLSDDDRMVFEMDRFGVPLEGVDPLIINSILVSHRGDAPRHLTQREAGRFSGRVIVDGPGSAPTACALRKISGQSTRYFLHFE